MDASRSSHALLSVVLPDAGVAGAAATGVNGFNGLNGFAVGVTAAVMLGAAGDSDAVAAFSVADAAG